MPNRMEIEVSNVPDPKSHPGYEMIWFYHFCQIHFFFFYVLQSKKT